MELIVSENSAPPPPKGGRTGGDWAKAKQAACALLPGQSLTVRGLRRTSVLAMSVEARKQTGGKFTARTNPDRSVTIYRTE